MYSLPFDFFVCPVQVQFSPFYFKMSLYLSLAFLEGEVRLIYLHCISFQLEGFFFFDTLLGQKCNHEQERMISFSLDHERINKKTYD